MPKQVFNKISYDRQIKLLKPAIKEFVTKPYEKITVSSLTDTMKILRTDFYYYFEGKDDIYDILLSDLYGLAKDYKDEPTINDAAIALFEKVVKISGSRNRQFIIDLTESYNPQFAIYLAQRLKVIFNCKCEGEKPLVKIMMKIYKFMTVVNLYKTGRLNLDVAREIISDHNCE